jgi:hypothetical protein|uniref:Uncharacterized protein n=1 Tax=Podoviridae sp. ctpVv1 TaxID=2827748 RepID=A0A8S5T330_9CAUD|nr:MAG TPA: hypothetical protein [Podoviridae sp. ctpVv1]
MYVVLTLDEYSKLKETSRKLDLFIDSLNHELELKTHEINISKKFKSDDVVKNLRYEYSGMLFVKDIFNITMSD